MPRSLGSVHGGAVTLFLGGRVNDGHIRVMSMPGVLSVCGSVAVSGDGSTLLVSDSRRHAVHEFSVADGSRRRVVGASERGDEQLQFFGPSQVYIASDDFVFVAERLNHRVQVLSPRLDFHGFVGVGQLEDPVGVCATADVVVVTEHRECRMSVFDRSDGVRLRRVGGIAFPDAVCLASVGRHILVTENYTGEWRVRALDVEGNVVGVALDTVEHRVVAPSAVAWFPSNELAVAERRRVALYGTDFGHEAPPDAVVGPSVDRGPYRDLACLGGFEGTFSGVAVHGRTLFVHGMGQCFIFTW
jgi:hypothetical protein